ncbi:hypothetical protein SLS61_009344 [Didymella pomorum]
MIRYALVDRRDNLGEGVENRKSASRNSAVELATSVVRHDYAIDVVINYKRRIFSSVAGAAYFGRRLLEAVTHGDVPESRLDDMAQRVMTPYFLLGQDKNYTSVDSSSGAAFLVYQYGHGPALFSMYPEVDARDAPADHTKIICEVGTVGTVLLKNVKNTLPLKNKKNIRLFSNDVPYPTTGSVYLDISNNPEGFEMGTVDVGGRSGTVRHTSLVMPLETIEKHVDSLRGRVQLLFNNKLVAEGTFKTIYLTLDACLLFLKAYPTDGEDPASLNLQWNATKAVESTAAMCSITIVVMHGPDVVLMPSADNENVTAILSAHCPGEETGNAITDILWGLVEPSGRLLYTVPRNPSDYGTQVVESVEANGDPS